MCRRKCLPRLSINTGNKLTLIFGRVRKRRRVEWRQEPAKEHDTANGQWLKKLPISKAETNLPRLQAN